MNPTDQAVDYASRRWEVLRQDDPGNKFVVASGLSREEAEYLAQMYTDRGHKQLYWASVEPE